jgi:hypothetical protein
MFTRKHHFLSVNRVAPVNDIHPHDSLATSSVKASVVIERLDEDTATVRTTRAIKQDNYVAVMTHAGA